MTTAAAATEIPEAGVEQFDTVVIGGGQAGLSAGYYLKKLGRPFVILDANERIGGSWRTRTWDSLRLFTTLRASHLSGAWTRCSDLIDRKKISTSYTISTHHKKK